MSLKKLIPSPSMAVALLALMVALSGSAYASVKLSKNSVTTKTIKKGAVTGVKIKNKTITGGKVKPDSLTGTQINEASLAGINAATVGGKGADAFVSSSDRIHFNTTMARGDAPKTLATFGSFTLTGHCDADGPTNIDARLTVKSSSSAAFHWSTQLTPGVEDDAVYPQTNIAPGDNDYETDSPAFYDSATGFSTFDGDGEAMGMFIGYPGADCRFFGSFFID